MKNRTNVLLLILVTFLSANLVFQSCQKDSFSPVQSSASYALGTSERSLDSLDFYKNMVAKCVARGLGNTDFQEFFKRVAARNEGDQDGFSLWHYRDSIVSPNQTLARFLSARSYELGYNYNPDFFSGHLVRYIPNLSIGIAIWDNVTISNYVFNSSLKVAVLPSDFYSDTPTSSNATMYTQSLVSSVEDVDNANYDFVYVEENPYYELFKTSNNKSLNGDKTVPELQGLPTNDALDAAFTTDANGTNYKFRLPGAEVIGGANCFMVDKFRVISYYTGGPTGPGGDGGDGGDDGDDGGDGGGDDRGLLACTGDCERDNMDGYESVRFVQMVHGSDLRKKFGCRITHKNCTFAITEYRFVPNSSSSAAVADQTTKVVSLWEKGLRNGLWVWWNDVDNKYVRWKYCEGEYGDQMLYNVIGKNPQSGNETTSTFGIGASSIKFKISGLEASLPLIPNFSFSKKKTNKDFDFGETENVYYCDPNNVNNGAGQTYSTGSVRLRIREL